MQRTVLSFLHNIRPQTDKFQNTSNRSSRRLISGIPAVLTQRSGGSSRCIGIIAFFLRKVFQKNCVCRLTELLTGFSARNTRGFFSCSRMKRAIGPILCRDLVLYYIQTPCGIKQRNSITFLPLALQSTFSKPYSFLLIKQYLNTAGLVL